jgi:hypothetical protein
VDQAASGCQRGCDDHIAQALAGIFRTDPIVTDLFDAIRLGLQLTNRQGLDMPVKILYQWAANAEHLDFELQALPRPRDFQKGEDQADLELYLPQRKGEGKCYMNPLGTTSDWKNGGRARRALGSEKKSR